jgi:hypothetical protein
VREIIKERLSNNYYEAEWPHKWAVRASRRGMFMSAKKVVWVLLVMLISSCTSTKERSCIDNGGNWHKVCIAQNYFCVMPHSDAGQPCNSSSECKRDCIAVKDSNGKVTGQCSGDNNPCGCWEFYNNGKVVSALCVD